MCHGGRGNKGYRKSTANLSTPTASSSKSPQALLSTLVANGLPSTPASSAFAAALHSRAPRKAGPTGSSLKAKAKAEEERKKAEKERADLLKQRFSILDDAPERGEEGKREKRDKGKGKAVKNLRKRGEEDVWEIDEEEREAKRLREDERFAREKDPAEREARLRAEDAKERDEFAARMKDKDKDRTKKLVEDRSSKLDAEALARRALSKDPSLLEGAMPSLRERSRQSYLGKREQQQLDLLRIEIADEERDFKGIRMSKREVAELERKKQLLRLAEERLAVDEGFDGYQMPDGAIPPSFGLDQGLTLDADYITEQGKIDSKKKKDLLSARYSDAKPRSRNVRDAEFTTDLEQYEMEQTAKAQLHSGAMDR